MQVKSEVTGTFQRLVQAMAGSVSRRSGGFTLLARLLFQTVAGALQQVNRWRQVRRQRRALYELSDYMLKDIGISRYEAMREAEKPFWKV